MASSLQIEERAGEWLARRDNASWGAADEAAFEAWLAESTAHTVAFVRLDAAWQQAKRLKALSAGVTPGTTPSPEQWQLAPFFDQTAPASPSAADRPGAKSFMLPALAASVLLLTGVAAMYFWSAGSTYSTPIGGIASVPMNDGSSVTLNTDSKIRLALTSMERRVELEQGEAFFDVAKDPHRPFVVAVGNKRIVAVGTQFSVRRDAREVRVVVTEGRVRVEDAASGAISEPLAAGTIVRAGESALRVEEATVPEVENHLSWRTGYLMFLDAPLADAAAEFNRYNAHKIEIADPAVGRIRISGKFRATRFEAFVRLVEDGFPVRARHEGDRIVLDAAGDFVP